MEYKRGTTGPAMFQRHVRFQVDISTITKQVGDNSKENLFAITFTLLSGEFFDALMTLNRYLDKNVACREYKEI